MPSLPAEVPSSVSRSPCCSSAGMPPSQSANPAPATCSRSFRPATSWLPLSGAPELIRGDWIKPGAVVVDAGYNAGDVGDVEQAAAAEHARLLTPVPGGVGPRTIAMLLSQTVDAAERRQ